jgi:hypothetical protein
MKRRVTLFYISFILFIHSLYEINHLDLNIKFIHSLYEINHLDLNINFVSIHQLIILFDLAKLW